MTGRRQIIDKSDTNGPPLPMSYSGSQLGTTTTSTNSGTISTGTNSGTKRIVLLPHQVEAVEGWFGSSLLE